MPTDDPVNEFDLSREYSILCNSTVIFFGFIIEIAFGVLLDSTTTVAAAVVVLSQQRPLYGTVNNNYY